MLAFIESRLTRLKICVNHTDDARWREGVRAIAEGMRYIRPPSGTRGKTGLKLDDDDTIHFYCCCIFMLILPFQVNW